MKVVGFCPFQVKCYQYYPLGRENEDEDEKVFTDVGLKVTYKSELESNYHYKARVYRVEDLEVNALEYDSLCRTICKIFADDDELFMALVLILSVSIDEAKTRQQKTCQF